MVGRSLVFLAVIYIAILPQSNSLAKRPFWSFLSGGASSIDNTDQEIVFSSRNNGEGFIPTIRRTTASDNMPYAPLPLDEKESSEAYLSEVILLSPTQHSIAMYLNKMYSSVQQQGAVERQRKKTRAQKKRDAGRSKQFDSEFSTDSQVELFVYIHLCLCTYVLTQMY